MATMAMRIFFLPAVVAVAAPFEFCYDYVECIGNTSETNPTGYVTNTFSRVIWGKPGQVSELADFSGVTKNLEDPRFDSRQPAPRRTDPMRHPTGTRPGPIVLLDADELLWTTDGPPIGGGKSPCDNPYKLPTGTFLRYFHRGTYHGGRLVEGWHCMQMRRDTIDFLIALTKRNWEWGIFSKSMRKGYFVWVGLKVLMEMAADKVRANAQGDPVQLQLAEDILIQGRNTPIYTMDYCLKEYFAKRYCDVEIYDMYKVWHSIHPEYPPTKDPSVLLPAFVAMFDHVGKSHFMYQDQLQIHKNVLSMPFAVNNPEVARKLVLVDDQIDNFMCPANGIYVPQFRPGIGMDAKEDLMKGVLPRLDEFADVLKKADSEPKSMKPLKLWAEILLKKHYWPLLEGTGHVKLPSPPLNYNNHNPTERQIENLVNALEQIVALPDDADLSAPQFHGRRGVAPVKHAPPAPVRENRFSPLISAGNGRDSARPSRDKMVSPSAKEKKKKQKRKRKKKKKRSPIIEEKPGRLGFWAAQVPSPVF